MLALSADRKVNPGALNMDGVDWSGVFIGPDPIGLGGFEVAVAISDHVVSPGEIRQLHKLRLDGRDTNLVVAVVFGDNVTLFGPNSSLLPQIQPLSAAERKLQAALNEPDTSQATRRFLALSDSESSGQMAGVRDRGLFASYHLRENVSKRADWSEMMDRSEKLLDSRGRQLIEDLGFTIAEQANDAFVLADSSDETRAVALLLDDSEFFDHESPRFHSSPVAWGLGIAAEKGLPWLIMLRHEQIRLYPAKDGVGVGQKGQTETYLELDLAGIAPAYYGLLSLIFSASALAQDGTAQQLLEESNRYATELGVRLRDRIYTDVVPDLARAVANQMKRAGHELDSKGLQDAYRTTLRILFRILFQAYAEDRGLLPLERNPNFYEKSLTAFAKGFLEGDASYGDSTGLWDTLQDVWTAIDEGNPEWSVPAYNGGLFGSDPERRPYGALIKSISLPDSVVGPALSKLLVDQSGDGVLGMIDFRSLSVREFGTIYEGLLESSLSLADTDLTLDANGVWLPAQDGDTVEARAGEPYFHNTSGERKATGSYFTPDFIVDHLIERAIDPTLDAHLERISALLKEGKHAEAAKNFFDYRVADIAMGSAHFLVAAVDRIESKLRTFLATPENAIPGVKNELERLAEAARVALGSDLVAIEDIDEAVLLRRQIARRCIYGIDANELAVELARLAIWIHTFVPGLPMSSLDHNLVCANSLTGIGSIDEGLDGLLPERKKNGTSLFDELLEKSLLEAKSLLERLSDADESDRSQANLASALAEEARRAAGLARVVFDLAVAVRSAIVASPTAMSEEDLHELHEQPEVQKFISAIGPAHMPYLFPEVFLRENPGFDALLGNPPFKEMTVEELDFWNIRFKGMKSLKNADQASQLEHLRASYPELATQFQEIQEEMSVIRRVLSSGPYPGMGVGDPDLYKAFAWRFLGLCRESGAIGLVLPQSIWTTLGNSIWRKEFFSQTESSIVQIINTKGWAFENVNAGYRFSFIAAKKGDGGSHISIRGIFDSKDAFWAGVQQQVPIISGQEILNSDENAALPSLDGDTEISLWAKLLSFPALSDGRLEHSRSDITCAPATEIHVSEDGRKKGIFTGNSNDFPVFNHLNVLQYRFEKSVGAFNHAEFDNYVEGEEASAHRLMRRSDSALRLWGTQRLNRIGHPIRHPRLVFRDVIHASNPRKVWVALAPANTLLTNKAPYLIFRSESIQPAAYALGVLNSGVVDWFGTLRIGLNLNFFILYSLPVPQFIGSHRQLRIGELATSLALIEGEDYGEWSELGDPVDGEQERRDAMIEIESLICEEFDLTDEEIATIYGVGNRLRVSTEEISNFRREGSA